jgi:hypothetical protein
MDKINLDAITQEPIQGHTSKGDQPKWQLNGKWYKADHMGYEALAEVLVSQLLKQSNVSNFVEYKPVLIQYRGKEIPGCASQSFQAKDEMLVPFERLHRAYKGQGLAASLGKINEPQKRIRYTVDFIEQTTGLTKVGDYLTLLLELDSFFLNEDRHTNNLAVIRNEKSKEFRLCPVFDNGLALLSDIHDYPLGKDIYDCISHVRAKPFDLDFDVQVEAAEELYGTQLNFSFTRYDVSKTINMVGELYSQSVIARVERTVYEQMRKYPIYFS